MKSYSAYFVRNDKIELARTVFQQVEALPNTDWLMCAFHADAAPPDDSVLFGQTSLTLDKSKQLGEIIFLYGDTSCDGFVYEHANQGELLRKLVWFPLLDDDWTAGWICVKGHHETWENELFTERELSQYLQEEQEKLAEFGQSHEFVKLEADIKHTWQNKHIVVGKTFPRCDGTVTLLVEKHYGIRRE